MRRSSAFLLVGLFVDGWLPAAALGETPPAPTDDTSITEQLTTFKYVVRGNGQVRP